MFLLDNTVLSNFGLVHRLDLFSLFLGEQASTTPQVLEEYNNGVVKGILPDVTWEWLNLIELSAEEEILLT